MCNQAFFAASTENWALHASQAHTINRSVRAVMRTWWEPQRGHFTAVADVI
jgi:hypothetical protein